MRKTVWKWVSQEDYALDRLAAWLEEQAAAGLWLTDFFRGFARFDRLEPGQVRYHLEPAEDAEETIPDREVLEAYLESGWQYVCAYGKLAHVYRAVRPDAPPLHTDPVAESWALDSTRRQAGAALQLNLWGGVALLLLAFGFPLLSGQPYTRLAQEDKLLLYALAPLLLLFAAGASFHSYRQVRKRQELLAAGLPAQAHRPPRTRPAALLGILSVALYLLTQWSILDPGVMPEYQDLSSYRGPLPVADEAALEAASRPGAGGGVSNRSYPLMPVDLIVHLNKGCSVEYRRLAWDWLAEGLARERAEALGLDPEAARAAAGFTRVYCGAGRGQVQSLVALRGRTVVEVRCPGAGDLAGGVEALAAAVDAYEEAVA